MKWFYDLKIATKLIVSFGTVLLMTLVMGVCSILSMGKVNYASTDLAENWMPSVRVVMDLRAYVGDYRRWELAHLLNEDPQGMAGYEKRIEDTITTLRTHRQNYEKLISSPEEKTLAAEFDSSLAAFLADHKMMTLSPANQKVEARAVASGASAKILSDVTAATSKLVKLNTDGGEAASAAASDTFKSARWTAIVLLAANIVIGMALARDVAGGDLTRDNDVKSDCETGQLMQVLKA